MFILTVELNESQLEYKTNFILLNQKYLIISNIGKFKFLLQNI